jgi:transposase-like protein
MHHPPFCPNRSCPAHWPAPTGRRRQPFFRRAGSYHSRRAGRVQRFQCRLCSHRFSETSFSIDYFAKRRVSYHRLLGLLVNGAGLRGIARELHVSPGAVSLRILHLARGALALHAIA